MHKHLFRTFGHAHVLLTIVKLSNSPLSPYIPKKKNDLAKSVFDNYLGWACVLFKVCGNKGQKKFSYA